MFKVTPMKRLYAAVPLTFEDSLLKILGKLGTQLKDVTGGDAAAGTGLIDIFGETIPTYYFQIIVGLYVVQITYILTILVNGIENGLDNLNEKYQLGNNLIKSTILYVFISALVIIIFNFVASQILVGTMG